MSESDDRIQRALNDAKKRQLEERFGGVFGPSDASLPPDVEADWLQNIEELESRIENVPTTTVRKYLGDPEFDPLHAIPEEELPQAIRQVQEFMEERGVVVHSFAPESDEVFYRFLTEELPDEEIDDFHMEGMTQDYIYEMYHPNPLLDACICAESFVGTLFRLRTPKPGHPFPLEGSWGISELAENPASVLGILRDYFSSFETLLGTSTDLVSCCVARDEARAFVVVEWSALQKESMEQCCGVTNLTVEMRKGETEYWRVTGLHLQEGRGLDKRHTKCVS